MLGSASSDMLLNAREVVSWKPIMMSAVVSLRPPKYSAPPSRCSVIAHAFWVRPATNGGSSVAPACIAAIAIMPLVIIVPLAK